MSEAGRPKLSGVKVRWMIRRDMADVLKIENESFDLPWREEDFLSCLRQRNCIGMVTEHEGRVVGYTIYELFSEALHILSLAVSREHRHSGVGSQMVGKLMHKLSQQRRVSITTDIRESNIEAHEFFRNFGFKLIRVERNYYKDTSESVYRFRYQVPAK